MNVNSRVGLTGKLALAATLLFSAVPAYATDIPSYLNMDKEAQARVRNDYIESYINTVYLENTQQGDILKDYFIKPVIPLKTAKGTVYVSEGFRDFSIRLNRIIKQADEEHVDVRKIQVEKILKLVLDEKLKQIASPSPAPANNNKKTA